MMQKFFDNRLSLIVLSSACCVILISMGLRQTFGLFFGFFKGYIVSVCIFSILNWFYPYKNWGISAEDAISFDLILKGSEMLIEEFPSSEDFIDTKEKIEKI